jgi:serine/threonine-protein kinase
MTVAMAVTGTRVLGGRYALAEVLGAGGMATVWRARDEVLGRDVAVKVLSPQYAADPGFLARFQREARHVAALSHPRLVTVFDCDIDHGTAYIVMELVAGRTLRQVLDDAGPLPPAEATAIAAAVCEGLEVAHAAGLVHRDIKPANIVLSRGGVKMLDFGIARADGSTGGTRTQGVLGTAAYLSPELASGAQAGPQADLYSLGCVLFEMLTGEPPFAADSAVGLAYRHVHDDPGPPSARRPGLPPRLDWIVGRLLAKDPAARPPGAAAARADLLAAQPVDATAGRADLLAARPVDATAVLPLPVDGTDPSFAGTDPAFAGAGAAFAGADPAFAGADGGGRRGSRRGARRGPGRGSRGGSRRGSRGGSRWSSRRRVSRAELWLAGALAAALTALAVTLALAPSGSPAASPPSPAATHHAGTTSPSASGTPSATPTSSLPPTAAAASAFVGDLQAGVADGQVSQQAGQDLFNQLQQLLFQTPDQQDGQQVQQQYSQLVGTYDQHQSQGDITGHATIALRQDLQALGAAVGAL